MEHAGYLSARPRRPGMLASVVAVHLAGLAGVAMFAPVVTQIIRDQGGIPVIDITQPPPPPPVDDPQKPVIKTAEKPDTITRSLPVAGGVDTTRLAGEGETIITGGLGEGTIGPIVTPIDPPVPPLINPAKFTGRNAQPPYPPGLQRMDIAGSVTVRVLVGTDGRPVRIEMVRADNDGFFTATRDWGMKKWRFMPATRDGVPFEEWRTMTVRFDLT
jgi:periplasmic protein TonB